MVYASVPLVIGDALAAVLASWLLLQTYRQFTLRSSQKRPPEPSQWPLIGSVLEFPTKFEWFTYGKWGEKYGPMVGVSLFGQKMLIVNKHDVAFELLDKKSAKYSDRLVVPMAYDLVGWKHGLGMLCVGDRFRSHRKMFHQVIGTPATFEKHHSVVEHEVHQMLTKILDRPLDFAKHIRSTTGAIVLRLSHGYEVLPHHDPFVKLADEAIKIFGLSTNVAGFLVNFFPALKYVPEWFPGAGFKRLGAQWRRLISKTVNEPYDFAKARWIEGTAKPSLVSALLEESSEELTPLREHDIKWCASTMYIAGVDTTFSTIYAFCLAMMLHPETALKVQTEMDQVLGDSSRLPTLSDRPSLPYTQATILEAMRWHAVVPYGIPHLLSEDDYHRGYFIPKGTLVVSNVWQMLNDPEVYPEPSVFNPGRFLGENPQCDPRTLCFGFGRRICPGMHMADASVFIGCAMILSVFNLSKPIKNGKVQEPTIGCTPAIVSEPLPFECDMNVRSEKARELIKGEPIVI